MKACLLLLIMFGSTLCASAQNFGEIEGMIADSGGRAIMGVRVDILDKAGAVTGRGILTRSDGSYALTQLGPGLYDLQYSSPHYCVIVVHGVAVNTNNGTDVNLHLHTCETREYEVVEYERPFMNGMPQYFRNNK